MGILFVVNQDEEVRGATEVAIHPENNLEAAHFGRVGTVLQKFALLWIFLASHKEEVGMMWVTNCP